MSKVDSFHAMFVEELQDMYDAEQRLVRAIPTLTRAATNTSLVEALESHLNETEEHVARLETVFKALEITARGTPCAGIRGIIDEAAGQLDEDFASDSLRDATIIGAAQRAEHYEIAVYGTAVAHARLLALDEVAETLEATLDEEKAADATLTIIAESVVNREAVRQPASGRAGNLEGAARRK